MLLILISRRNCPQKWRFFPSKDRLLTPNPRATRNIFLIRHGHYDLSGATDEERRLTELGRKQAAATGKRLAALKIPWTRVVRSNMTRAMETCDLIHSELPKGSAPAPEEPPDPALREGAPVRPEPDAGSWKAEADYFVDGARVEAAYRCFPHKKWR